MVRRDSDEPPAPSAPPLSVGRAIGRIELAMQMVYILVRAVVALLFHR
jgi:hypothetical protein